MTNILTAAEAAITLRTDATDTVMLDLLPAIDAYLKVATGRDWTRDATISPIAKNAARMLLVNWYENPGMVGNVPSMSFGLSSALVQLEAKNGEYYVFEGRENAGEIIVTGICEDDQVLAVVGLLYVEGDQAEYFETVISEDGEIQQISDDDLSGKWFEAHIVSAEAMR